VKTHINSQSSDQEWLWHYCSEKEISFDANVKYMGYNNLRQIAKESTLDSVPTWPESKDLILK
jgi:hypothetical protein